MQQTVVKSVLGVVVVLGLGSVLQGRPDGVAARGTSGCGSCHGSQPNANGRVLVSIQSARLLQKDATIPVSVAVTGGPSGTTGGFCVDTTAGTLQGGTGSKVSGASIVHANGNARSWTFQFAGSTTGLVKWTAVAMASNGSGTGGDSWGFWGPDSGVGGVPYRLFVTDSQVFPYGKACAGTGGFEPMLGVAKNMTNGQTSTVELHNAKPGVIALLVLGFSNKAFGPLPLPFDLGLIGAKGCNLLASMDLTFPVATTGSGDGNGVASWPFPLPSDPGLRGLHLYLQSLVIDKVNTLGLVGSAGLDCVIQ